VKKQFSGLIPNNWVNKILDEIELRASKVPSAPWIYGITSREQSDKFWVREKGKSGIGQHICFVHYGNAFQNEDRAEFISAARTDVPKLVKALRRAVKGLTILDAKGTLDDITAILNGENL